MSRPVEIAHPRWPPAVLVSAALFIVWEVLVRTSGGSSGPPAPSAVLFALFQNFGFLGRQAAFTLFEAIAGLALALVLAFGVSSSFARSSLAHRAFMPLVLAAQTVPMLAIAPLLATAIGEGAFANVIVTAYLCWFPAVIAFTHGFLNVDEDKLTLFEIHGARADQVWRRLRLPNAAPALVAGIRTSAGLAVISAIVSEYGTLVGGIGATIVKHIRQISVLPIEQVYALVLLASVLGLLFTEATHRLARYSLRDWLTPT